MEYDEEGEVIVQGEYIDGRKEKWYYKVGDHLRKKGITKDGLKDGAWVRIRMTMAARTSSGTFMNGEPDGKHKWWRYNGQLKLEGQF